MNSGNLMLVKNPSTERVMEIVMLCGYTEFWINNRGEKCVAIPIFIKFGINFRNFLRCEEILAVGNSLDVKQGRRNTPTLPDEAERECHDSVVIVIIKA